MTSKAFRKGGIEWVVPKLLITESFILKVAHSEKANKKIQN